MQGAIARIAVACALAVSILSHPLPPHARPTIQSVPPCFTLSQILSSSPFTHCTHAHSPNPCLCLSISTGFSSSSSLSAGAIAGIAFACASPDPFLTHPHAPRAYLTQPLTLSNTLTQRTHARTLTLHLFLSLPIHTDTSSGSLSSGAIAGIAVGCALVVAAFAAILIEVFVFRPARKQTSPTTPHEDTDVPAIVGGTAGALSESGAVAMDRKATVMTQGFVVVPETEQPAGPEGLTVGHCNSSLTDVQTSSANSGGDEKVASWIDITTGLFSLNTCVL